MATGRRTAGEALGRSWRAIARDLGEGAVALLVVGVLCLVASWFDTADPTSSRFDHARAALDRIDMPSVGTVGLIDASSSIWLTDYWVLLEGPHVQEQLDA